jgi:carbamoyltransferase
MNILGIWDGHDSGAALLVDGRLLAAANEERFTRRKLECVFPAASIRACLDLAGLTPADIDIAATCTLDVSKALGRLMPGSRERFYLTRRRRVRPGAWLALLQTAQSRAREWGPTWWSKAINRRGFQADFAAVGLGSARIRIFDHHRCHAAAAAYGSSFQSCVVVTIDGLGDGCSATVSRFRDGRLTEIARTSARHSPGVFFEHITALLNMRPLEDEGKVMALADYSAPVPEDRNSLLSMLNIEGLRFRTCAPAHALRRAIRREQWFMSNEQFAFMAQRTLERACATLVRHAVEATGESRVALAGGVTSNVKVNRTIRCLEVVDDMFVFPHMGDGGLAVGAAVAAAVECGQVPSLRLDDPGLGPAFDESAIGSVLLDANLQFARMSDLPDVVAGLLAEGAVVLWFQGRMEYGPRALGHRSILARPDRPELRDRLNLILKRRVWYQPFCPSMLDSVARAALADYKGAPNRHMTTAYMVRPEWRQVLSGVLSVDGTCRPQFVRDDDPSPYGALLRAMRARGGVAAVLNTSFNIHGSPLVCTPKEAVDVLIQSGADWLAIGPFLAQAPTANAVSAAHGRLIRAFQDGIVGSASNQARSSG